MGPPGTVCCFMCKGMIIYKKGDKSRFNNHMNNEHGVVFELDFLFITCKLNEKERVTVKNVMSELMVDKVEDQDFSEEHVKKQLRKIIPVIGSRDTEKDLSDGDGEIEVIKAVTASEKIVSKDDELEHISKKRRLSESSTASSGVCVVSDFKKPLPTRVSQPSDVSKQFRIPPANSVLCSIPQTPMKIPSLVTPRATPRKNSHVSEPQEQGFVLETPIKGRPNTQMMQTPRKTDLETARKVNSSLEQLPESLKTPLKTPQKSTSDLMLIAPPSTVKKRNSGYAPSMFPCDECDKGYSSKQARANHKRTKHTTQRIKTEGAEQEVVSNLALLDQGQSNNIRSHEESSTSKNEVLEGTNGSNGSNILSESKNEPHQTFHKAPVRLFPCDGCGKNYKTSMSLKMHKKRSCKAFEFVSKSASDNSLSVDVTLQESADISDEKGNDTLLEKTVDISDTQEIQNMLMKDNLDDDDDEDDEDDEIQMVDIFNKTSEPNKEIPIGKIKNETQVDPVELDESLTNADTKDNELVEKNKVTVVETDTGVKDQNIMYQNSPADEMILQCERSRFFSDQNNKSKFEKCPLDLLPTFQEPLKCLEDRFPGWKKKKIELHKKDGQRIPRIIFLSPENIVLKSGLGVLEYLRIIGASRRDLEILSLKLKVIPEKFTNYIGKYMFDHKI